MPSARPGIAIIVLMAVLMPPVLADGLPAIPCSDTDHECAVSAIPDSPVLKVSFWKQAFDKPVENRLGVAPDGLVTLLNLDNIAQGYPNKPHAAPIPADFLQDVKGALADMPARVKRLLDRKLAGIYFVKDLGSTGYTQRINGGFFSEDAGLIVLDMDVLGSRTANDWITWKERTPFRPDSHYRLDARIETDQQDTRRNAILYILLHELGHVLSIGENFHPPWDETQVRPSLEGFPFAQLSWEAGNPRSSNYASLFDSEFPLRRNIVYYLGARLKGDQMVDAYHQLEKTSYPTLYAATSPAEDFADSFVNYVHVVLMKRPFEIRIHRDGVLAEDYQSCWNERRCAGKRRMVENFLRQ